MSDFYTFKLIISSVITVHVHTLKSQAPGTVYSMSDFLAGDRFFDE